MYYFWRSAGLFAALLFLPLLISNEAAVADGPTLPPCSPQQHNHPLYGHTKAPDGNLYPTWMPQVDNRYNCHYGHEHGTNPAVLFTGWRPPFGYASTVATGQPMFHEGYKGFGFYDRHGNRWYIVLHQGSSRLGALCNPYHDMALYVEDGSGERLVELYWMGDFGHSQVNASGEPFEPVMCPTQFEDAPKTGAGTRLFPTVDTGSTLYNPWRLANRPEYEAVVGLYSGHLTIWADSTDICEDRYCADAVATGRVGTKRLMQITAEFGINNPAHTGNFCTDPYLTEVTSCDDGRAVRQYIAPSVTVLNPSISGKCYQRSPWDMLYVCDGNAYDPWAWGSDGSYNLFGGITGDN